MHFGVLGKSRHHQMVLGPPNWSSDFPQKLGVAGPAAFAENTFWKMTPKQKHVLGNWETLNFRGNCDFVMPFYKQMTIWGGFPVSRKICFVGGSFFKMYFRRRPPDRQPLALGGNPRTHLEVQGPLGDEVTFQECQKSWILKIPPFGKTENWRPGVYFDAKSLSAHSRRAKTPWIAIWSKIFRFVRKSSFPAWELWFGNLC